MADNLRDRCYRFGLEIIKLCDRFPQKRSAWVIADQLIRAATSIGANLIEGKAASSRLEYKKFFEIALKSANEARYWLHLVRDAGIVDQGIAEGLLDEANQIASMLAKGVISLKKKNL